MSPPTVQNFTITRGSTFLEFVRWAFGQHQYAAIASISKAAPGVITTQAPHNIPAGWREVAIVGAQGMTELNAENNPPSGSDYRPTEPGDASSVKLDGISTLDYGTHKANTGSLQWWLPPSLAGYTARMSIKSRPGGTLYLTSLDGGDISIELDDTNKQIVLRIEADITAAITTWKTGSYDLEVEAPDGTVEKILTGKFTVAPEVTTPITP